MTVIDAPARPQPGDGPEYQANLLFWAGIVRPKVEKGRWYPDTPPLFKGETTEQYTDRLTGADHLDLVPYNHPRMRWCSIGYHTDCSANDMSPEVPLENRSCLCPCHPKPLDIENLKNALDHIRLGATVHYIGGAFEPEHMRAIANLAIDALNGEPVPALPDPTEIRRDAQAWVDRLADLAD